MRPGATTSCPQRSIRLSTIATSVVHPQLRAREPRGTRPGCRLDQALELSRSSPLSRPTIKATGLPPTVRGASKDSDARHRTFRCPSGATIKECACPS